MANVEVVPEPQPPFERLVRSFAGVTAAAALMGLLIGGVFGRLAMFVLARLSPEAEGVESDDGFVMGQFTVSGSLNLLAVGTFIGVLGGAVYFVVRGLRFGPRWFQVASIAAGAAVVVGSMLVHSDGLDFNLLHPLWLAVVLFLAIPGLFAAALTVTAERWIAPGGVFMTAPKKFALLPLLVGIPLAPIFLGIIIVSWLGLRLREDHGVRAFLDQAWLQWAARLALTLIFVLAAGDLIGDVGRLSSD